MWYVWENTSCIQGFDGKPDSKRPFGQPRHIWQDNVKMNLPRY